MAKRKVQKTFGIQTPDQRPANVQGDTQRTSYWYWTAQAWVSMVQEVLGTLLLAVITCTIGYRASTGVLSAGLAGLALSYAINMPRDLMWLSRRIASIEVDFVSIERVLEYIRLEHEEVVQSRLSVARIDASLSVSGIAISSVDVWFQYAPDLPWVLRGLSLQVPKGIRAAIVGRTGCGKSSFLCALARLYGVSGGCLAVHGRDVMQTPLIELRQTVRVLLQEPIFFQGSIRSNLLCCIPEQELELNLASPPSSQAISDLDTALWHALMQAGLEKLVRGLPRNLDEPVQEGGRNFSHGERQLLCLARVLLDPAMIATGLESDSHRVLLCDEPTSACDLITDEHIHSTLLHGLPKSWTLIVICHRLHRIREFDEVYVLDTGQVAEHGPPNALLENLAHGKLAAMCRQQGML